MSESESNLSDFSEDDEREQVDKENLNLQSDASSSSSSESENQIILDQQRLQRQQFYNQQQALSNLDDERPDQINLELNSTLPSNVEQGIQGVGLMDIDIEEMDGEGQERQPVEIPEYMVDRIDSEKWPGVNGHYDNEGEWREWHEMTTAINVYSGDIVNILPYVNISC